VAGAPARSVPALVRALREHGADGLAPVPRAEQLARKSPSRRREILDELRVDLHALSALLAEAAVERARRHRPDYPPYGLARSGYSASRLVAADPEPFPKGSIASFDALGKAFVDTTIFHLRATWNEQRHHHGWVLERLEELLAPFRAAAGPAAEPRMRDGISFLYGGLHFGTGVSVQLVEVMATVLEADGRFGPEERVAVLHRSTRPALRLAALNVEQVATAFQNLQDGGTRAGWMAPGHFSLLTAGDGPARIDLRDDALPGEEERFTFATLGCPARVAMADGGPSAITGLWSWCVDLARDTGLLEGGAG